MSNRLFETTERWLKAIWPEMPKSIVALIFEFIGAVSSFALILAYFDFEGTKILKVLSDTGKRIWTYSQAGEVPVILWLITLLIFYIIFLISRRVRLVAGAFTDDFSKGLINWEYGGGGLAVQRGEKGYELSVTHSGSGGGISNFGYWDNYIFSFECKVINRNVGWIIRATDRDNYIMIQLSLPNNEGKEYSSINPHYRIKGQWLVIERRLQVSLDLTEKVLSHQWLKVSIVVFGNTIDVFINKERVLNYRIPDPLRIPKKDIAPGSDLQSSLQEKGGIYEVEGFSFPAGRVGFRCFGQEHALIRNVKVEPKFWNSSRI